MSEIIRSLSSFKNGVNTQRLKEELRTQVYDVISVVVFGDDAIITLVDEPNQDEMGKINGVCLSHSGAEPYGTLEDMERLRNLRQKIFDSVKINLMIYLIMTGNAQNVSTAKVIGKDLIDTYALDLFRYIQGSEGPIVASITADTDHASFLDDTVPGKSKTIRTLILEELQS